MQRSRFLWAAGFLGLVSLALTAQNVRLRALNARLRGSRDSTARPLLIGDTLASVVITDISGRATDFDSVLSRNDKTVVFFYRRDCSPCAEMWADWTLFVEVNGVDQVVFLDCGSKAEPPPESLKFVRRYQMRPIGPLRDRFPYLPQIVTVNRCGVVTGVFKSVYGIHLASR